MKWLLVPLLVLSLPIFVGFVQGLVEGIRRRPLPRLRLVAFEEDG